MNSWSPSDCENISDLYNLQIALYGHADKAILGLK